MRGLFQRIVFLQLRHLYKSVQQVLLTLFSFADVSESLGGNTISSSILDNFDPFLLLRLPLPDEQSLLVPESFPVSTSSKIEE